MNAGQPRARIDIQVKKNSTITIYAVILRLSIGWQKFFFSVSTLICRILSQRKITKHPVHAMMKLYVFCNGKIYLVLYVFIKVLKCDMNKMYP